MVCQIFYYSSDHHLFIYISKHHRIYIYWIFLDLAETSKVSRDISCFEVLCQQDLCCDRTERLSQRGPGNVIKNLQHRIPNIPRELKTIKTFQKQKPSKQTTKLIFSLNLQWQNVFTIRVCFRQGGYQESSVISGHRLL